MSRKPEYLNNKKHESRAILKQEEDSLVFNIQHLAATVSSPLHTEQWTERFKEQYETDTMAREQLKKPRGDFGLNPHGLLLFQGRAYVPSGLRKELVEHEHGLPAHGHQGVRKTLDRVSRTYYFPGIRKVVKDMVRNCDTCIRNKAARYTPYGELKIYTTPP